MEANQNKNLEITIGNETYKRLPIKTSLVLPGANLEEFIVENTKGLIEKGDVVFVTEKIVAITQGRAYPIKDVKPRKLATTLAKYVTKTPHGIGLGMPETMEMALRECGTPRILLASFAGAVGKVIGRKGDFYRVAGYKARSIDGPTPKTIPPFNEYVVLGPINPNEVAHNLSKLIGADVLVVDINDLGGNILGSSNKSLNHDLYVKILKDNPLGQESQSTPLGIIRK